MENRPLTPIIYIFRLIFRNVIIFGHNLIVYLPFITLNANLLLLIPGLILFALNAIFYASAIAFLSTRFPDMGSIVSSLLQVVFFFTPIMWMPQILPAQYHAYLLLNPFLYLLNLLRNPLLGLPFTLTEILAITAITLFGLILFRFTTKKYSPRIIFWL